VCPYVGLLLGRMFFGFGAYTSLASLGYVLGLFDLSLEDVVYPVRQTPLRGWSGRISLNQPRPSFSSMSPASAHHALTHPPSFHLGVFFLFGAGRLALIRSQPHLAISYYTQAMHAQQQYRNLHYISYWEMAISYLALWDLSGSLGCWRVLEAEGNVSLLLSFCLSV
jgi:hypothetical protein